MKRIIIYLTLAVLAVWSCAPDVYYELPDGDKFDNLYIVQAKDNPVPLRMKNTLEGKVTKSFSAFWSGLKAPHDINISFEANPYLVNTYNAKNGTHYLPLPESAYTFPKKTVVIKQGEYRTGMVDIDFNVSADLTFDVSYLLPVKMSTSDVKINESLQVLYFAVEITRDLSPVLLSGSISDCDELFSFNDKCILAHDNFSGQILRYAYDPATTTIPAPTVLVDASMDPSWGSPYTRLVLPCRNSLHEINQYENWIAVALDEDATTMGYVSRDEYTFLSRNCGILSRCIPNQHSAGAIFIDKASGGLRIYIATADGLGLTSVIFKQDFNYSVYDPIFFYQDDLYGVDSNGLLWRHPYNSSDKSFGNTPVQVGEGWGNFTHIVPFGTTLLCRQSDGSMLRFAFNPEFYWDATE